MAHNAIGRVVNIEELPAELEKRNALSGSAPIRVIYEWRYTWNLTLIDTPGTSPPYHVTVQLSSHKVGD